MVQLFQISTKEVQKIMITQDCARMLIRDNVSMHVECIACIQREKGNED